MKSNAGKILSIIVGIIVVIFFFLLVSSFVNGTSPFKTTEKITINKHSFKVHVASSDSEKEIGLSQTKKLPDGYGMLFPFETAGMYSFWMRDMKFPIDIVYINGNKIVQIFKNVPEPKNQQEPLKIYVSSSPADKVLEIKAGLSDKYKLKNGDIVSVQEIK